MPGVLDVEVQLLLEAIQARYHHDFRGYAAPSITKRVLHALELLGLQTVPQLQDRVLHDVHAFAVLLQSLTVPVSDFFRDPGYFRAFRERVVPLLATYPSIKLWVAGCGEGEEVHSLAITLAETGLLDRTLIYATDIHAEALRRAEAGVYALDRVARFTENYRRSGGTGTLADYYAAAYRGVLFDRSLRRNVVFSDHSLATDSVFAEVQMVSCRNVLIYFDRQLQDRAVGLFAGALCPLGFLGMGAQETLRFSAHAGAFREFASPERIYRKSS